MRLRPYQLDDLNRITRAFNGGSRRLLYQLPTGAGKTAVFADLIREVHAAGLRVIALSHRDEIMLQVSESLRRNKINHGIIAPGYPPTEHRVQVASVFTLVRRLKWLRRESPQLVVIDEAHHTAARTWKKIMEAVPDADVLGVTATPQRLDGKPLGDFFDELIVGPSIAELIDEGWLAPVTVFTPPRDPDLSKVVIRAGDYDVNQLSSVMSGTIIVKGAVDEYARLCLGRPAIAFCVDIRHSKLVVRAFRQAGLRAEHVDGETGRQERRELMATLTAGEIDVLSNCGLISEGLDVPGVEAAILLRPTRSLALYLQMVGRALRPGKDLAYVLDHAGNVHRHGLPATRRHWTLNGRPADQANNGAAPIRCSVCGAMNAPGAAFCTHCGAALHRPREPDVEVPGVRLAEALEAPLSNDDLASMSYHDCLRWCAGEDGRLRRNRLAQARAARKYKPGWVLHNTGKNWSDAWDQWKARPL